MFPLGFSLFLPWSAFYSFPWPFWALWLLKGVPPSLIRCVLLIYCVSIPWDAEIPIRAVLFVTWLISLQNWQRNFVRLCPLKPVLFLDLFPALHNRPAGSMISNPNAHLHLQVFFDMTMDGQPAGRIVIGLFGGTVPKTVRNFKELAEKPEGEG